MRNFKLRLLSVSVIQYSTFWSLALTSNQTLLLPIMTDVLLLAFNTFIIFYWMWGVGSIGLRLLIYAHKQFDALWFLCIHTLPLYYIMFNEDLIGDTNASLSIAATDPDYAGCWPGHGTRASESRSRRQSPDVTRQRSSSSCWNESRIIIRLGMLGNHIVSV